MARPLADGGRDTAFRYHAEPKGKNPCEISLEALKFLSTMKSCGTFTERQLLSSVAGSHCGTPHGPFGGPGGGGCGGDGGGGDGCGGPGGPGGGVGCVPRARATQPLACGSWQDLAGSKPGAVPPTQHAPGLPNVQPASEHQFQTRQPERPQHFSAHVEALATMSPPSSPLHLPKLPRSIGNDALELLQVAETGTEAADISRC